MPIWTQDVIRMHIMAQPDLVHNLPGLTHVDLGAGLPRPSSFTHKEPIIVARSSAVAFRGRTGRVDNHHQKRDLRIR